ncbi:thioredoxin-like protein [Corynespora cassiicola Philippines]|uniref:Thioredoxin-like protein n=1 Tax=Corynespora cassiicola Philippines TaxID=1448308 RepID=A0A2T2PAJ2_CORCC|nr:thioredoxin-like protein [Corynespora cassiicola Philippines]
MSQLGRVRIGHRAPDFHCEAVIKGVIEEVNISTYISPNNPAWLILLFIPAAFSFVCPTEVLAFQNCLDEFKDRNCNVVFVSVDTKHSLWHWQNVPRQYGGLGQIDIALLSDASHKVSRDYGVLIEEEGVCLRGMFILDEDGIVQQVTLNNLTVGRSVLEALRLLEAFQAVAKHGVLCPVDWKPSDNAAETINAISNTLTESYDERLANLQKEFGDTVVTDLDAKHKREAEGKGYGDQEADNIKSHRGSTSTASSGQSGVVIIAEDQSSSIGSRTKSTSTAVNSRSDSGSSITACSIDPKDIPNELPKEPSPSPSTTATLGIESNGVPPKPVSPKSPFHFFHSSAPASSSSTPTPTPGPTPRKPLHSGATTARHSRGHSSAPTHPLHPAKHTSYESRRGSHVVLEFADPTSSPQRKQQHNYHHHDDASRSTPSSAASSPVPPPSRTTSLPISTPAPAPTTTTTATASAARLAGYPSGGGRRATPPPPPPPPAYGRAGLAQGQTAGSGDGGVGTPGGQTRLQATFEAIKKMGTGLGSPRVDFSPRKGTSGGAGAGVGESGGYFDVVVEGVEG